MTILAGARSSISVSQSRINSCTIKKASGGNMGSLIVQLGWTTIEVVDDDLGRSAGGIDRPGFERLLAAICEGRVGPYLRSRRLGSRATVRDWHTLIEFCGFVGTIIVDEDGIYDPRHPIGCCSA